ncbi:MAG: 5-bromo-4-chloroindolyl phosphate hydrolysis family protein [Intestinimonas massiliensis]|uniref:5-bromo-4-chloroindolyl phosphate hydrolysis family protein n=1 Tax=Intestinimonas TaxID=1392389 RepID=UPI00242F57D5|nr:MULTISPECIES: 5-bromo-4-chloroindolyl phosphate hydrolysis family protein [Intestinimonas]MCI5561649.1 5-bromo-4-chloroindolyl phosphate hydrolysis family protein [Intestinimonas massiliensis (ex Afouda et al. 2020)]MDY5339633.1 5-bromo-4-chloroindolyl phosphate hydrolysis family protein [Intestinimonas sp.]
MAHIVKKSPWPVYAVGLVWLIFGLFLLLYKLIHFLAAAGLSIAAYLVVQKLCPDKTFTVPDPEPEREPATTGSPELDELIRQRDLALSEMHRLNDSIEDPKISAQIDHMEAVTAKIIAHVVEHPRKLPQIRKFLNYYLPTTLKLLNAYDRMDAAGISGANIDGTMGKIETMMDTVATAFDRQLDALFGDEALDISTDITVMENMLAREGLAGESLRAEQQ